MPSPVDICNLALARIGNSSSVASIAPPEQSTAASKCAMFYPQAVNEILEMHAWDFATTRATVAAVTDTLSTWAFAYALPQDCLKAISVQPPGEPGYPIFESFDYQPLLSETNQFLAGASNDQVQNTDFVVETDGSGNKVLYSNAQTAIVKYVRYITDTTKFSPLFISAVVLQLGGYLAGAIPKDLDLQEKLFEAAMKMVTKAAMSNANESSGALYGNFVPASIASRR